MFTIVARFDAINPENKTNKIVIISTAKRSIIFITIGNLLMKYTSAGSGIIPY
jgi:hypothetical protein